MNKQFISNNALDRDFKQVNLPESLVLHHKILLTTRLSKENKTDRIICTKKDSNTNCILFELFNIKSKGNKVFYRVFDTSISEKLIHAIYKELMPYRALDELIYFKKEHLNDYQRDYRF